MESRLGVDDDGVDSVDDDDDDDDFEGFISESPFSFGDGRFKNNAKKPSLISVRTGSD